MKVSMARSVLVAAAAAASAAATTRAAADAVAGPRPNIIWIMADDMGWGEPGLYPSTSDHGRISTPHLDAFGASGLRFTNAYAGYTVCAPSRTTLMTGYHSGHFPAQRLNGQALGPSYGGAVLPQLLHDAGYATAGIGKMAPLTHPTQSGFDFFIGQVDQGLCHNMYPQVIDSGNSTNNVDLPGNHRIPAVPKTSDFAAARAYCMDPANQASLNYTVDITHANAVAWVANKGPQHLRDPDKPFFLYEAFTVPHAGGWGWQGSPGGKEMENGAPVPTDGQYANESAWPEVERDHAAVITYLDAYIGELMATLDAQNLTANTLVWFASDNGAHLEGGHDYQFFNSTGGLLGHKRSLFEGGVRSPTMVRWPGTIAAGTTSDFAWAFWDVLPTVAALVGAEVPAGIDGESILPTLMGQTQPQKEYLAWTWRGTGMDATSALAHGLTLHQDAEGLAYYRDAAGAVVDVGGSDGQPGGSSTNGPAPSGYALRSGEWKIVVPHCGPEQMASADDSALVFHLPTDPFETNNVNETDAGKQQRAALVALAIQHNVTCNCFQC